MILTTTGFSPLHLFRLDVLFVNHLLGQLALAFGLLENEDIIVIFKLFICGI